MQAIAATLEEALCPEGYEGTECAHHTKLVEALKAKDEIISFNYDCVIDETLRRSKTQVWNARYGYGFNLGRRGKNLSGDDHWMPKTPAGKTNTVTLYKLHGSFTSTNKDEIRQK